ncbi:Uma2 family endonuclease [Dolichospermum planctonicum CS-1226]|uniref:Uma2 family endonuclease n=1 Tax=Dolichospermum planctonicum CS-1226 TaxID=3021751 RepID=A0ABT5AHA1_9CYAN|nr:Uma2 family endonuclease [Dolichospermum planctonicum]MDB9535805.1 Uma2 family endonuclease [Dolichospermum planctonicum CS-1226]
MTLTIDNVEKIEQILKDDDNDYQIELQEGNILIMGPSDIESSEIGAELIRLLGNWIKPRKLGRIFDSSGGFILPNTDLRAPDVSFVSAQRLKRTVRDFGNLVPDLVVEIKSKTDRVSKLEYKLKLFLELGAKVAILINPDELTVTVYRPDGKMTLLTEDDKLTVSELFPGWEIAISELWPPVFE